MTPGERPHERTSAALDLVGIGIALGQDALGQAVRGEDDAQLGAFPGIEPIPRFPHALGERL